MERILRATYPPTSFGSDDEGPSFIRNCSSVVFASISVKKRSNGYGGDEEGVRRATAAEDANGCCCCCDNVVVVNIAVGGSCRSCTRLARRGHASEDVVSKQVRSSGQEDTMMPLASDGAAAEVVVWSSTSAAW